MNKYYRVLTEILEQLKEQGVYPIVYGSIAVSFYVGKFKDTFSDYDLLVNDTWLEDDWALFQNILRNMGYELIDEYEHEFVDSRHNIRLNFAKQSILERDKICSTDDIVDFNWQGYIFHTLSAQNLLRAYQFSQKDGYRKNVRGKKDAIVVAALTKRLKEFV